MNSFIEKRQIRGLDVELSNVCNLKCPLCLSQLVPNFMDKLAGVRFLDIGYLISELDQMPDLNTLSIAGDASEPTLHPELFRLLDYAKSRQNLSVELYTNASAKPEQYWRDLALHFSERSTVFFTICGSTQELHQKYRVGSDLGAVIRNALAFKSASPYSNDRMQYIKFEYNKNDDMDSVLRILKRFSSYGFVETDPIWERLHLNDNDCNDGVCSTKVFAFMYKMALRRAKSKLKRNILCNSFDEKYVRMDAFGRYSPCVCYLLHRPENAMKDGRMDYSEILNDKCDFCYECDSDVVEFMSNSMRDSFYVC